ncbi:MAG: DEAD/DEAH box helicase [Bacteroidota bacterium]
MRKFSAAYSFTNQNFVIQNLDGPRIENEFLAPICILKNVLQRGCPSRLSKFLQRSIGAIHQSAEYEKPYPLISKQVPKWQRVIRGDEKGNYYPAKKFFDEIIPTFLPDYQFIQPLLIPEMPLNLITMVDVDEFAGQQVDFYLPQAYLVIEIDGRSHTLQQGHDAVRDAYLAKYGVKTIRISTTVLEQRGALLGERVSLIKDCVQKAIDKQSIRRETDKTFISLSDYKHRFENAIDFSDPNYQVAAIIRFQILVLELIETGKLDFSTEWNFEIFNNDNCEFADLALLDLFEWFQHLFKLHKITWNIPQYSVKYVNSINSFSFGSVCIKVDFSLSKRYTDEFQLHPDVIFVRTDYLDEFRFFKKGDGRDKLVFSSFQRYDHFSVSTAERVNYQLKFGGQDTDEASLIFLLGNIFLQEISGLQFNEGQLTIIANALRGHDTIGLLPTGSGKSVCYQLAAILQPGVSFVVCPIKSLMYDQVADLHGCSVSRISQITSDNDGEDKERIQSEFAKGRYLFIFISPERFQIQTFRDYLSAVNKSFRIIYAVVDEVHCLSEWGHDFRTAYLNLSRTIGHLCKGSKFIGLTATASLNVLKDIQIEFGVKQEDVRTPLNYTRKELLFEAVDDFQMKEDHLKKILADLDEVNDVFGIKGPSSRCGIIFTPTVSGKQGCYALAKKLSSHFKTDVRYYSGTVPKIDKQPVLTDSEYDEYKMTVQNDFKESKFTLLTATKAFGMGVNKQNIHYTIHYGIPGSMEALYQEGGRAGRDKIRFQNEQARCIVLLSKSRKPKELTDQLWLRETHLPKLNELLGQIDGDLNSNLFLFASGLQSVTEEFQLIKRLYETYSSGSKATVVEGSAIKADKAKTEKAIYRLSQLGIVSDWTISNFFSGGKFEVDFIKHTDASVTENLLKTIHKYQSSFSLDEVHSDPKYIRYAKILNAPVEYSHLDKSILLLLQWSYDNFAYHRRESLKNIYENTCLLADGTISQAKFKETLENYFKFNQSTYILQYIAENPKDVSRWFEPFHQIDNNTVTDKLLTVQQQEALRDNLRRFLESYMYNPGLDLISGMVRLWLNDFEDTDGRNRLESALKEVRRFDAINIDYVKKQILKVGAVFRSKQRILLSECLCEIFTDEETQQMIFEKLQDEHSLSLILDKANIRLQKINSKIYGGLRKVEQIN